MSYTTLLSELQNGILIVTVNRPDKLNAINRDVMTDLDHLVSEVESNDAVRAVILTGAGPKAFVAGADISEFLGLTHGEGQDLARRGQDVFFRIENCRKPFVAAVNGFALGGGCELAMACHFRTASDNARFGQPEVNLGLIPGYGGTQRLPQLIGKGRAMEMLMTGNMLDAATALQYGLVNHVVSAEELIPKTIEILSNIITKAPFAVGCIINAVNAQHDSRGGFTEELESFGDCFATEDMKEGTDAFLNKRKPVFKGS